MELNDNAKELFDAFSMFKKIIRSYSFLEEMNFNEVKICGLLIKMEEEGIKEPKIQIKDLSDKLRISRPAINSIINKLEEKELIERIRIQGDRKSVYVKLTEKSYKIYYQEQEKMIKSINEIVKKMGNEDTIKLTELLIKFYDILYLEVQNKC